MAVCASCGTANPDGARFCNGCAEPLAQASPGREERKVVSVVFVDLVGSTARAERLDPEDVRAQLTAYHARVRTELERHGGTVEKFIGDAVVAVFGAPVVHEDDPERAVRAAIAIRDTVAGTDVELRVAVNTGEALVALDARPTGGEGMVAGDVMNTASRIQAVAPVNGVLVGEATYRATSHVIDYRPAEAITAKGKAEPVAVWEAVAPKSRFGSDVEQTPLVPIVGREPEVDALRAALTRARQEREPQLMTLIGVPGIGKSRLVAELFAIVDDDPEIIVWRQGRCLPYGEGIAYWAIGEMTKAQAGVLESDAAETASRKLSEAVAALIPDPDEGAWVVRHLGPLIGLVGDAEGGSDSRGEAFAAWRRFFEALGEQRPTVLVFEDLHWADDGLLDFVDGLVDRATGVPLLVLCSARPELLTRRPGWGGGKANAVTLSLSALSDENTARLISEHLSQAALPAQLQQTLLLRAEGNPLFAEEYIRMLRDRGLLRREGKTWRLDRSDVEVPETVQGIIAARLDALPPEEKELLQAAAVVGKVFWLGAVASVAGVSTWETEERLHSLERKEFVRRDRRASVAGDTEYAVRHVLVRDVAYGQIPRGARAELHARTAEWIRALGDDRAEDRAAMVAHHYGTALDLTRAADGDVAALERPAMRAFREAGDRAQALSALDAAAGFYRRALELWPEDDADHPHLVLELGRALAWRSGGGAHELEQAAERLVALGELEAAADAETALGDLYRYAGQLRLAHVHLDHATQLIDGLPDTPATVRVRAHLWRLRLLSGETAPVDEGRRLVTLTDELGTVTDQLHIRASLGLAYSNAGDPATAIQELEQTVELALQANSHVAVRAVNNLASILDTFGDLSRSMRLHREGLALARRFGSRLEPWLAVECARDSYVAGQWDDAIAGATAFLDSSEGAHYMDSVAHHLLAATAAARGNAEVAARHARLLLQRAREILEPQVLPRALGNGAMVMLELGDRETAAALLDELVTVLADTARYEPSFEDVDGLVAAFELGGARELGVAMAQAAAYESPWVEACIQIGDGRLDEASDLLHAHGAHAYAALVRLHRAERAGRETAGLCDTISFYERVGATAYLARARRLLPASA